MIKDLKFLFNNSIDVVDDMVESQKTFLCSSNQCGAYASSEIIYAKDVFWKDFYRNVETYHLQEMELVTLYYMNPYQLSNELYGIPLLGDMLLKLNDCLSVYEFVKPTVYVFNANGVDLLIKKLSIQSQIIKAKRFSNSYGSENMIIKNV